MAERRIEDFPDTKHWRSDFWSVENSSASAQQTRVTRLVVFVLELSGLLFVLKLCLLLHTFRIQLERYYFYAVANS